MLLGQYFARSSPFPADFNSFRIVISRTDQPDTLIIGGGIIGLSVAWELSRRGNSVVVLERSHLGRGNQGASSWAGAGILPPAPEVETEDPYEQLLTLTHQLHPRWAADLRSETGIDTGFRKCGGLYLAASSGELATLVANQVWWADHGIDFERLTEEKLLELEPNLKPFCDKHFLGAWLLPAEWQLRNPRQLEALHRACASGSVSILQQTDVVDLPCSNRELQGVMLRDGTTLKARNYCVWRRRLDARDTGETGT